MGCVEFVRVAPDVKLGRDVKIHAFVNLYGCEIGDESRIGTFVEIQKGVRIGSRVKVSSHTFICEGVTVEDEVFIGHGVKFINDKYPRATTIAGKSQTEANWVCVPTLVKRGASIGSNATILCGVTIGERALVGAGSVVTHDVPDGVVVVGNPARALRRVVYISGCWDLIHVGHLWALEQARDMGGFLVVGVNTDELVLSYKGRLPTIPYQQRAAVISAMEFVDAVVPHSSLEDTIGFKEYGVNIRAIGPDYGKQEGQRRCIAEHKASGIEVIRFSWCPEEGISSTKIKEGIKDVYPSKKSSSIDHQRGDSVGRRRRKA